MDATFEFAFTTICTFTFNATFVFSKACSFVFNLDFPFSKASICASNKPFILVRVTAYSSWIFTISLYLSPLASNYMFLLSIVFNCTIKNFITFYSFMFVSSSNLNAFEIDVFFHQLFSSSPPTLGCAFPIPSFHYQRITSPKLIFSHFFWRATNSIGSMRLAPYKCTTRICFCNLSTSKERSNILKNWFLL